MGSGNGGSTTNGDPRCNELVQAVQTLQEQNVVQERRNEEQLARTHAMETREREFQLGTTRSDPRRTVTPLKMVYLFLKEILLIVNFNCFV